MGTVVQTNQTFHHLQLTKWLPARASQTELSIVFSAAVIHLQHILSYLRIHIMIKSSQTTMCMRQAIIYSQQWLSK